MCAVLRITILGILRESDAQKKMRKKYWVDFYLPMYISIINFLLQNSECRNHLHFAFVEEDDHQLPVPKLCILLLTLCPFLQITKLYYKVHLLRPLFACATTYALDFWCGEKHIGNIFHRTVRIKNQVHRQTFHVKIQSLNYSL